MVKDGLSAGEQLCITYIPFAANNAKVKLASDAAKGGKGGKSKHHPKPGENKRAAAVH